MATEDFNTGITADPHIGIDVSADKEAPPQLEFDFGSAFLHGVKSRDVQQFTEATGAPPVLYTPEHYKEQFSDIEPEKIDAAYPEIEQAFKDYNIGEFYQKNSTFDEMNMLKYNTAFQRYGFETLPFDYQMPKPISHNIYYGPGAFQKGMEFRTPDQVARGIPYMFDKNDNLMENKAFNRRGRNIAVVEFTDPNSNVNFMYKEFPWTERLIRDNVRSVYGEKGMNSPWNAKVFSWRGFMSNFVGLNLDVLGAYSSMMGDLGQMAFAPEKYANYEDNILTEFGNSLSNLGASYSHMYQDQQLGPFESWSSFFYNVHSMFGQIAGMVAVSGLAASRGYYSAAPFLSIGLGASQMGSMVYHTALEHGASPGQAAGMFFTYGSMTYLANMVIGANLLQTSVARRTAQLLNKDLSKIAKPWYGGSGAAIPTQSAEKATEIAGKTMFKSFSDAKYAYQKASNKMREAAEKNVLARSALTGGEEFLEEGLEEFFHYPLSVYTNKNIFKPHADSILKERDLNNWDYFSETGPNGVPEYYKRSRTGTKVKLPFNVWQGEQDDIAQAQGVRDGFYPMEEAITADEAMIAGISSFFSGGLLHYIGGSHKARKANDHNILTERLAIDLAKLSPTKRNRALDQIRSQLQEEQKRNNIFGPNNLTPDGKALKVGEEGNSVSSIAIDTFIQDIMLNVDLINRSGINDPIQLSAMKNNQYLMLEAVSHVKAINAIEKAIESKRADQQVDEYKGLFDNSTTLEQLQQLLTAKQEAYRNVTQPKDGPKGKETSQRYSELYLENRFVEYLVDKRAEERATEYLKSVNKDPDYIPDTKSEEFIRLKDSYVKDIRSNPNQVMFLSWAKDPVKSFASYAWQGNLAPEVYSFLNHIYKSLVGGEMNAVVANINQKVKAARDAFSSDTNKVAELQTKIKELSQINLIASKADKMNPEQVKNITAELLSFQDVLQEFMALEELTQHSEMTAEMSEQYSTMYEQLNEQLNRFEEVDSRVQITQKAVSAQLFGTDMEPEGVYDFIPSADVATHSAAFAKQAKNLREGIQKRNEERENLSKRIASDHKHTREIGEIQNESPEVQADIRQRAIERFINQTNETGAAKTANTISIDAMLDYYQELLEMDQPLTNQTQMVENMQIWKKNIELFRDAVNLNRDFVQTLAGEDAQHSMLRGEQNNHLKFEESERQSVNLRSDDLTKRIDNMLEDPKLSVYSREYAQVKEMIRHIEIRNFHLGEVMEYFTNEETVGEGKANQDVLEAYHEIGRVLDEFGTNGSMQFRVWVEQFASDLVKEETEKQKILQGVYKVDAAITKMESLLGGRMQGFVELKMKQLKDSGYDLQNIEDFLTEPGALRSEQKIEGTYSAERFKNLNSDANVDHVYFWSSITWANNLNRLGVTLNGKKVPTKTEIAQAFRDVQRSRMATKDEIASGNLSEASMLNVATYEQEQAIFHLLGFAINPDQALIKNKENSSLSSAIYQIQKSLYLRGYAGSGKTTQVLIDFYQTLDTLLGESTPITVVVPNEALKKTHVENFRKIGKTDYKIIYLHDVLNKNAQFNEIIIFDEASILGSDKLTDIGNYVGNRTTIWIGDEAQTPDIAYLNIHLPIKRSAIERTYPMTEVFRSGNPDHFAIDDYFRSMASGTLMDAMPKVSYKLEAGGLLHGARYYENKNQLREDFITQWERIPEAMRTRENIIYVVVSDVELNDFMHWATTRMAENKQAIENIRSITMTTLYNPKNPNVLVSGIESKNVFFEFDDESFTQEMARKKGLGTVRMKTARNNILANTGRVGYTGESRRINFVGLIGDPANSREGEFTPITSVLTDSEKDTMRKIAVARLNATYGSGSEYTAKKQTTKQDPKKAQEKKKETAKVDDNVSDGTESEVEVSTKPAAFDRSFQLTEESRAALQSSPELANLKKQVTETSINRKKRLEKDNKNIIHATDIAAESVKDITKAKDSTFEKKNAISRARSNVFSHILRYHFEPSEANFELAIARIKDMNRLYDTAKIKDERSYFFSIYKSIASDLNFNVRDPLNLVNPTLLKSDVTVIIDGVEQKAAVEAHPALMKVIGFDRSGNPIVDVLEFVIHDDHTSVKGEPGPYTKAKIASYVAMAALGPYNHNRKPKRIKINRVFVSEYVDTIGALDYQGTYTVSDGDVIQYLKDIQKNIPELEMAGVEPKDVFVDREGFYVNERTVDHPIVKDQTSYYSGKGLKRERVQVTHVTQRVNKMGKFVNIVHYRTVENKGKKMPLSKFLETYRSASEPAVLSENGLFNHRANQFHLNRSVMGHALVFSPAEAGESGNFNDLTTKPSFKARMSLLGRIDPGYSIAKKYNDTMNLVRYNDATGEYTRKDFSHVVTNELTDTWINDNEAEVRKTLKDAGIKGVDKMTFDDAKKKFKDDWFHIISYENDPEAGFGGKNSLVNSFEAMNVMDEFLSTQYRTQEFQQAFTELETRIMDAFDKDDEYYQQLVDYNVHKLLALKALHEISKGTDGGFAEAHIQNIEPGNVKRGNIARSASEFISEMKLRGFVHGDINIVRNQHGRKYFTVEFSRPGIPGSVTVDFDAKGASIEYITKLQNQLSDFVKTNQYLKEFQMRLDDFETKDPGNITETDIEGFYQLAHEGFMHLENHPAFQFVAANRSYIRKIQGHIEKNMRNKKVKSKNKDLNFTGFLLEEGPLGVSIKGKTLADKARNLQQALKSLKDMMINEEVIDGEKITLRVDPFNVADVTTTEQNTEIDIMIDMLETNVELIKNAEVYTGSDQLTNIINENAPDTTFDSDTKAEIEEDGTVELLNEKDVEDLTELADTETEKQQIYRDYEDDDVNFGSQNFGIPLSDAYNLDRSNSESVGNALSEVKRIIGDAGTRYGIELKPFNYEGQNGVVLYGRLANRLMQLYGKEIDGKVHVLENVGRHEAMHFVMKYLLDRKTFDKVMNEAAALMGVEFTADTEGNIHEFIADSFMNSKDIAKPETLLQKFIQSVKEIAHWLGFYSLSFNEMMVAADRGFFSDVSVNPEANTSIESFDKNRFVSKWAEPLNVQKAVDQIGSRELYERVKNQMVIPRLKDNLSFGKSMTYQVSDNPASSLYYTFSQLNSISNEVKVGDHIYNVNGRDVAVRDMTPADFAEGIRTNNGGLQKDFTYFNLAKRDVLFPMLQDLFPNVNVEKMYRLGRKLKKAELATKTSEGKELMQNKTAEVSAHTKQTKAASDAITDLQELFLSTIPLYSYVENIAGYTSGNIVSTNFVSSNMVRKIFTDTMQEIKQSGMIDYLDFTTFFEVMRKRSQRSGIDSRTRDSIYSVWLEFGPEVRYQKGSEATQGRPKYQIKKGRLMQTGYLHILNHLQKLDNISMQSNSPFSARKQHYEDLLSGIYKTFKGTTVERVGIADFRTQRVNVRTNSAQAIERSIIEELMRNKLFDNTGQVAAEFGNKLKGINKGGSITVAPYGFKFKSDVEKSGRIGEYNFVSKKTDINASEMASIFNALGLFYYPAHVFTSLIARERKAQTDKFFNAVHKMLVTSKVNYDLSNAISEEIKAINKANSQGKPIPEDIDIFDNALKRLSKDDKALFDYMLDKIYETKYDESKATIQFRDYSFKTSIDARFEVGKNTYIQTFEIPSPIDLFNELEDISELITDVNAITPPSFNFTPQGNISHSLRKEMPADELFFGSPNLAKRIKAELNESGGRSPLVDLSADGLRYNNPILNNKIAHLDAYYVSGVKNDPKGKDFNNLVRRDFYITMIETLLANEIRLRFGSPRYNILMTPLAEQGKGLVIPFHFPIRGASQKFFNIQYENNKVRRIDINKKLVTDSVNDLVNYYEARQIKSLSLIKEVMNEQSIEDVRKKAIAGEEVRVAPENVRRVRQELQVGRDYVVVRENKTAPYSITIRYGNAAGMQNVIFDHEFRNKWREIAKEDGELGISEIDSALKQYDLLKQQLGGDFRVFAKDLLDTRAYEYFLRNGSKIPKAFFSDFDTDFMESLSVFGDQIKALNNKWLEDNADVQARFPQVKTVNDLFKLGRDDANAIYSQMKNDPALQKEVRAIKNLSARQVETDHLNTIRKAAGEDVVSLSKGKGETNLTREYSWPPMVEGIFMLHWLANESLGTLMRDDATNYADIPELIKRGHGLKAPGSPFDVNNSGGLGAELNVAVMEDIPGYDRMFGVKPGDRAGRKIWTDGYVPVNPITQVHMKRSHGGMFGNINDNVNKTVLWGRDHRFDQTYYFKMAMAPITEEMYMNSTFSRNMFNAMLGDYVGQFEQFYNEFGDFTVAVEKMADWVNNPANAVVETDPMTGETTTVLPRDKMVHFLVHESAYKTGATAINAYNYSETNPMLWSADNAVSPQIDVVMKVPTQYLRLQNINNADGSEDLHSFATQLFSVVGVFKHNAQYYNAIQNALASKTREISNEIAEVIAKYENDGNSNAVKKYMYDKVRSISGRSISNTRVEELLYNNSDPNTIKKKLFQTFISHLNDHLKPRVPGHNAAQQALVMNGYRSDRDGTFYLASDIGLNNDTEIADGYSRSLLRPLGFYTRDGVAFTSKESLESYMKSNPDAGDNVIVAPQEVIMRFPYIEKFGLNPKSSLAQVMSIDTPDGSQSLYETGFQRASGLGAPDGLAVAQNILELTQAQTVQELLNAFTDHAVQDRFIRHLRSQAVKNLDQQGLLGKKETRLTKDESEPLVEKELSELLIQPLIVEGEAGKKLNSFVEFAGIYFYNLNNALDVLTVRIPTSGSSSASAGRIAAFSNSAGNTIYTSAVKSILDGSDYDYDELHVFYHKLRGLTVNKADFENIILDNMLNYYKDARNYEILLTPIDLATLRARVTQNDTEVLGARVPHSIASHIQNLDSIFAGENLVGHFANQMRFTNALMAMSDKLRNRTVHTDLVNTFATPIMKGRKVVGEQNNYLQIIDFISKLVNAATDNPNEGGLLGKLNVKAPVTNLMLGMITSKEITPDTNIESLVLDEMNNPVLLQAVERVERLQTMAYQGAGTTLYEALAYVGTINKGEFKAEADRLMKYAHIGEQVNRLGVMLRLIQEVPGDEAAYRQKMNEINFALGQELEMFLDPQNLAYSRNLSIEDGGAFNADIQNQLRYLKNNYFNNKELSRFMDHEGSIRSFLNIKGIVANDPFLLAQLQAINSFNKARSALFFADKNPQINNKVLEIVGKKRLIFEEEYNDISHAVDRVLIGSYFSNSNHQVDLNFTNPEGTSETTMEGWSFNLNKPKSAMDFVNKMPEYVRYLKGAYPKNSFIKGIDIESIAGKPLFFLKFRNSIHMSANEKHFIKEDFRKLAQDDPIAADAIRYYNALVYGFSFRNGSFADIIDTKFEQQFTDAMPEIESMLMDNFAKNPALFAREIAMAADSIITGYSFNPVVTHDTYMRRDYQSSKPSYYTKAPLRGGKNMYTDHKGGVLVNMVYPKEVHVYKHGESLTNDFVYDQLSAAQLQQLASENSVTRAISNWAGVYRTDYGKETTLDGNKKPYRNRPFHDALARTIFNDLVKVYYESDSKARLVKIDSRGKLLGSKLSMKNANLSSRAISNLVEVVRKSFKGIDILYVDNQTTLDSDMIGYFYRGMVHLNTDMVQTDTLFHELAHPMLAVIKHVHPGLYVTLTNEAQAMLDAGEPLAMKIKEAYSELTDTDLTDEIISTAIGFNSVQAVQQFLAAQDVPNYRSYGEMLWERIKSMANRAWATIKSFFKGYELSVDPQTTSIKDLSNQIVQKALKGENVLNITPNKLKDFLGAAYDVPSLQKAQPVETTDQMRKLFTDVATFQKDGKEVNIPHYKNMDMEERVSHFVMMLPSMRNKYYWNGVLYNFDENTPNHIPRSKWESVIRDEIMIGQDERSMATKKVIVSWLNSTELNKQVLQDALGTNALGEYIFSEEAINEFLRGIHFTPTTKYYQYSEMYKEDNLRPFYNQDLTGYDPIVAVEFDHDNQMLVSLFNITNQMLRVPELTTPIERKNILAGYLTDPAAKRRGLVNLTNRLGDVSNFMMGLAASKFVNDTSKKIHIGTIATVNLQPERAFFETADSVILTSNAKAMVDVEPFMNDLAPNMQQAVKDFAVIKNGFSFERLLAAKYTDEKVEIPHLEDFYRGTMDINDKKRMLMNRLRDINKANIAHLSNAAIQEIKLIIDAMNVLDEGLIISEQMNSKKDFSQFENSLAPQFDANHPATDLVRRTVLNTSMKNVELMKAFKDKIKPFGDYFQNTFEENNPAYTKYLYDVAPKYYERIIAHIVDDKGVKRNAGHVLWTTDSTLDPLFADQARELSPKDLEMGKLFVDTVTDVLTQNMYHRRIMKHGDMVYDPDIKKKREYTEKGDARNDLLTKTTYRPGMIPLMPDTVSAMASKGNIWQSILKRKRQIESSYVMFDEMAQLSDAESNFIDTMPDMFMQQFLYNPNADQVGSLGLQGKRMRNLLGLTEILNKEGKAEYTYDNEANRAIGLNTDLEILLEFFHMTTIRKISYENDVLPLLNGAKTYLLDTHTNQQFKQTNVLKYLEMYTRQAIEGKRRKLDLPMAGFNIDSTVSLALAYTSPLVMAMNVNVGIVSATHNFMMSFIEGVTNSLTDSHWAGVGHMAKGSALYFSDWNKVSQLSHQYQIINPNEYEIVTHRYNQPRKKFFFSDHTANWTNWATDAYARSVVMTAQMMRDGSYEAHSYSKESGKTDYNPKLDKRFEAYFKGDESHPEFFKQKALYEGLKKRLVSDGIALIDGEAAQAYSLKEARTFKALADKYIVGAYGPMEKNLLSNFLIGRAFMMFTTWLMTKVSNAFKRGSYIDELGYFEITQDDNGNLVPQWMREWTEGYMNTVWNAGRKLVFDGDTKQFTNMKNAEKKNLLRFATTLLMFAFFKLLYSFGVDDDRERKGMDKHIPNLGLVPNWRMTRNVAYATSSLLVVPTLVEKAESPFAVMGIMRRALAKGLFGREIQLDNLRYIIPTYGGIHTVAEPFRKE